MIVVSWGSVGRRCSGWQCIHSLPWWPCSQVQRLAFSENKSQSLCHLHILQSLQEYSCKPLIVVPRVKYHPLKCCLQISSPLLIHSRRGATGAFLHLNHGQRHLRVWSIQCWLQGNKQKWGTSSCWVAISTVLPKSAKSTEKILANDHDFYLTWIFWSTTYRRVWNHILSDWWKDGGQLFMDITASMKT